MIQRLNFSDNAILERALTIQKRAYRIEADLIGFDGIPQLHETVNDLRNSDETFIGYFVDEVLAGLLSYEVIDRTLNIGRLVIAPEYFRRGVARALVNYLDEMDTIDRWIVSTGAKNQPARKLYESLGYALVEELTLPVGVAIANYQKMRLS